MFRFLFYYAMFQWGVLFGCYSGTCKATFRECFFARLLVCEAAPCFSLLEGSKHSSGFTVTSHRVSRVKVIRLYSGSGPAVAILRQRLVLFFFGSAVYYSELGLFRPVLIAQIYATVSSREGANSVGSASA